MLKQIVTIHTDSINYHQTHFPHIDIISSFLITGGLSYWVQTDLTCNLYIMHKVHTQKKEKLEAALKFNSYLAKIQTNHV